MASFKLCPKCSKKIQVAANQCRDCYLEKKRATKKRCVDCGCYVSHSKATRCKECNLIFIGSVPYDRYCNAPKCSNKLNRTQKKFCSVACKNNVVNANRPKNRYTKLWPKKDVYFLTSNYSTMGASKIAKALGKTHKQVINKANKLKLKIDKKTARMIVHSKASEYMYKNNPMFNDKVKRKVKKFWSDNPEKYQEQMKKLFTGHSKLRKDKPTKLEKKLYNILGAIGVPFDKQAIIKPKFIVDAKIGNLIIEADGDWWHGHKRLEPLNERQIKQQVRDKSRNKYLTTCGYKVERIWESDMSYDVVVGILKKHNII